MLLVYAFILVFAVEASANDSCSICRNIAKKFQLEFERTSGKTFVGGNSLWEKKNIGTYATSESRFHDIFDLICVESAKRECHIMLEALEENLESWWKLKSNFVNVQLKAVESYLCIDTGYCCDYGNFGPNCNPCSPCSSVGGNCDGNGTRSGSGKCSCHHGYSDYLCNECKTDTHFKRTTPDYSSFTCIKCHEACSGGCNGSAASDCVQCSPGWTTIDTPGNCVDLDECQSSPCASHEFCVNTPGSYKCDKCHHSCIGCNGPSTSDCDTCANGFQKNDGGLCVDINECVELENICTSDFEKCHNTEGSYSCNCIGDYVRKDGYCVTKPGESHSKSINKRKKQSDKIIWTMTFVKEFSKYVGALFAFCLFCYAARRHPFLVCTAAVILGFYIYFQSITLDRVFALQL